MYLSTHRVMSRAACVFGARLRTREVVVFAVARRRSKPRGHLCMLAEYGHHEMLVDVQSGNTCIPEYIFRHNSHELSLSVIANYPFVQCARAFRIPIHWNLIMKIQMACGITVCIVCREITDCQHSHS